MPSNKQILHFGKQLKKKPPCQLALISMINDINITFNYRFELLKRLIKLQNE